VRYCCSQFTVAAGRAEEAAGIMTRGARLTRQRFIDGMFEALDLGRFDISLKDLCQGLGVTTGSFYSHFADMHELHSAVIEIWRAGLVAALPDTSGDRVHDPLDRLRKIRLAAAQAASRNGTIRRWAASAAVPGSAGPLGIPAWVRSAAEVAAVVAEVDQVIAGHLTREVTDLGFTGREAADLARWLAAALQAGDLARDQEGFETVLDVFVRAEAFPLQGPAVISDAAAPDAMRLYSTARGLPPDERRALGEMARLLAAARSGEGNPDGEDRAEAGRALPGQD
jgi:AcrR family transcriptional regulator